MALGFSFYGGKSGASYRLVEHFDSVKDMLKEYILKKLIVISAGAN